MGELNSQLGRRVYLDTSGLIAFDDVAYDDNADLLYDLASQTVRHFQTYLTDEEDVSRILRVFQREIARLIHVQMQEHYWEDEVDYEVKINGGFSELKHRAYTQVAGEAMLDYRHSPKDKSNMKRYLFTGFSRCLYSEEKFDSDSERTLSVILEREAQRWFKPTKGQFQIYYKWGADHPEYQPDFVAETADTIYMLEPKMKSEMTDAQVIAKRDVAVTWCAHASDHAATYGGKPWKYLLIPHDAIAENMTLQGLGDTFVRPS